MKKYDDASAVYDQLVAVTKQKSPVPLERIMPQDCLKMASHFHPWSIKPREFDFIRSLIVSYDLKAGFEIATAFGVSSLAAALGFKATTGKLVTMDAYVEEAHDNANAYREVKSWLGTESADGYKSVSFLRDWFALTPHLVPTIGWSPDDVPAAIQKYHGDTKLDFAFIDGGHWDEALLRDVGAVAPFIGERAVILFHDTHTFSAKARDVVQKTFGAAWTVPEAFRRGDGWYMGYIARGIDISELAADYS